MVFLRGRGFAPSSPGLSAHVARGVEWAQAHAGRQASRRQHQIVTVRSLKLGGYFTTLQCKTRAWCKRPQEASSDLKEEDTPDARAYRSTAQHSTAQHSTAQHSRKQSDGRRHTNRKLCVVQCKVGLHVLVHPRITPAGLRVLFVHFLRGWKRKEDMYVPPFETDVCMTGICGVSECSQINRAHTLPPPPPLSLHAASHVWVVHAGVCVRCQTLTAFACIS